MKISALRLFNVGRFGGRGVAIEGIGDGVNVLCAVNEFGKSTSFAALHALFFQPHSGTPGAVQMLRPYSGGSPIVEADISTANGQFRIAKQYYGGRSARVVDLATGRLVAQADEAENFIAGLVKGGTSGPAGLLWVRQGVTGVEKRTKTEEDGERQVRAGLLESVQGEVEAVTGGRRMAEIMAANELALSDLVTQTGRPKAGGRYAAALARRGELDAEERKLSGEVATLREALDRRAGARRRLAELDGDANRLERRRAMEDAQGAFDRAKVQGEALRTAEAKLLLARERRDTAAGNLTAFRNAVGKANEIRVKLLEAEERSRDAAASRRNVADASSEAATELEAAEARERDTRDLLARLDAATRARDAWDRAAELQDRLGQAEAARREIEEGEAKVAIETLSPEDVEELQALDLAIAKLHAVEQAARPSVTIAYEAGTAGSVSLDDSPLNDGEERAYDALARLSVPGIGTITLRSNRPPRSGDALAKAETKRQRLLVSMGVHDLAAARARQTQARETDAKLRESNARLTLLAPDGLPELREMVAALGAIRPEALELKEDPAQVRTALAQAEERRDRAKLALREVEPRRTRADDAFVAAETALASLRTEWEQAETTLGPQDGRGAREQDLSGLAADLERGCAEAQAHVDGLRAAAVDLVSVEAALKRVRSVEEAAGRDINALRETIAGLNSEISARSDEAVEEKWRESADALGAAKTLAEAYDREVAVLQRLSAALARARSEAREVYLKPVLTELQPLLRLLFDDARIEFDDKTLLPGKIRRNGHEEDVDRLSGGMKEQLSVLTRLAFARLLARDGRPAPVILDDALVYSDDDRIEKMFDALHRQSRDQQIIVFSCRQRAFQKLGGNILQLTDWEPWPSTRPP